MICWKPGEIYEKDVKIKLYKNTRQKNQMSGLLLGYHTIRKLRTPIILEKQYHIYKLIFRSIFLISVCVEVPSQAPSPVSCLSPDSTPRKPAKNDPSPEMLMTTPKGYLNSTLENKHMVFRSFFPVPLWGTGKPSSSVGIL